jgi:hypothetical protein
MNLRLGMLAIGELKYMKVLVGESNNIVFSAESMKDLVEKTKKEKDGLQITILKKEDSFVIIEADPESTKNIPSKKEQSIAFVLGSDERELRNFWLEYIKPSESKVK